MVAKPIMTSLARNIMGIFLHMCRCFNHYGSAFEKVCAVIMTNHWPFTPAIYTANLSDAARYLA